MQTARHHTNAKLTKECAVRGCVSVWFSIGGPRNYYGRCRNFDIKSEKNRRVGRSSGSDQTAFLEFSRNSEWFSQESQCKNSSGFAISPCFWPKIAVLNNFIKKKEKNFLQNRKCSKMFAETICTQPLRVGNCDRSVRRYWYNAQTRECQSFDYTGCQGNDNNFANLMDCQTFCRNAARRLLSV